MTDANKTIFDRVPEGMHCGDCDKCQSCNTIIYGLDNCYRIGLGEKGEEVAIYCETCFVSRFQCSRVALARIIDTEERCPDGQM